MAVRDLNIQVCSAFYLILIHTSNWYLIKVWSSFEYNSSSFKPCYCPFPIDLQTKFKFLLPPEINHFSSNNNMLQICLLFISLSLVPSTESRDSENTTYVINHSWFPWKLRLPESVKPIHYNLLIHPNLTFLNFTGSVQIQLDVQQDTELILLHSKNLHISKAAVVLSDNARHLYVYESEPFEQIALFSQDFTFRKGIHVIQLDFSANLSNSFHGFYKGSYTTQSGDVRYECILWMSYVCD